MQMDMFARKVTTAEGVRHICSVWDSKFLPMTDIDVLCEHCSEVIDGGEESYP